MPEANPIAALATEGIEVLDPIGEKYDEILTPEALRFVASLQRTFGTRRAELLARRVEAQKRIAVFSFSRYSLPVSGAR